MGDLNKISFTINAKSREHDSSNTVVYSQECATAIPVRICFKQFNASTNAQPQLLQVEQGVL
eukprot:1143326-Pelagomonas_calceolata.AAC.3